jgi:Tfp pilus assembly protein PilF
VDDDEDASTQPEQQQQAAGPGPGSSATAAAAWVEKGSAAAERGDSGAALRCWDQALLLEPQDGRVHEMRAQVLNAEGRTYEAIQAAQQVNACIASVQACSANAPHAGPATADVRVPTPSVCVHMTQAVTLRPDWPDAHITLARVQLNLGEPLLALGSYQAAAKLQPDHPDLVSQAYRTDCLSVCAGLQYMLAATVS